MLRFSVKSGEWFSVGPHVIVYDRPTSTFQFKLFNEPVFTGSVSSFPVSGYQVSIHCLSVGVYAKLGIRFYSKEGNEVTAEHIPVSHEGFELYKPRRKRRGKAAD
jgi:hypothetical protein